MPVYPSLKTDIVRYEPTDVYADQNIKITLLDGSTLEIWGTAFYNGNPLTTIGALPIATQAEAEAGVDNTKVMTPLRVNQAFTAKGAYTKAEADAKFVDAAGDIMTGPLDVLRVIITQAPSALNHATRKDYVDAGDTAAKAYADSIVAGINVGTLNIYTKPEVDAKFIDAAGDTMTGNLVLAADPSAPMQASTKQYVDGKVAAVTVGSLSVYTKAEADAKFVDTAGDSMTGPLVVPTLTVNGLSIMRSIQVGVGQGSLTIDRVAIRNDPTAPSDATNMQYVDAQVSTLKTYTDAQITSRSNYTYVNTSPPPISNYLTATVGQVTTPDPGPLPAKCVFVARVRGFSGAEGPICGQYEGQPNNSWYLQWFSGVTGALGFYRTPTGMFADQQVLGVPFFLQTTVDQQIAFSYDSSGVNDVGRAYLSDGYAWREFAGSGIQAKVAMLDTSSALRIGHYAAGIPWAGRIYSVELRTGLDPNAGSIIWKFDANEYVSGSSFTDVRGRTWTLTNPAAITKIRPANPGDVHIDTTSDYVYNYNGTNWINQGKLGAYTSVENDLPPSSYITPTVGYVTTPDPGLLPNNITLVYTVVGPTGAGNYTIAGQFDASPYSWFINRSAPPGNQYWYTSPDGGGATAAADVILGPISTGQIEKLALSITQDTGQMTSWKYTTSSWQQFSTVTTVPRVAFETTQPVRIGGIGAAPGTYDWQGRIYSVELRTGLDPNAGTVLWRFDANDYPGSGSVYTDPRGKVWTLSNPASITKVPIGTGDVHIDTSTDIVYKYNGLDWAYIGKLGDAANTATAGNTTTGTGFPEGVVTAPIGTRYIDTIATNGAVEWIKATGTGNTGWKVVYGDTGWRNIVTLMGNGTNVIPLPGTEPQILQRNGAWVQLNISLRISAGAVPGTGIITPPLGFQADARIWWLPQGFTATPAVAFSGPTLTLSAATVGDHRWLWQWHTVDPWPSTLPGTVG